MKYKITFEKAAQKFLKKQNPKTARNILNAISELPEGTDIKRLQGYDLFRLRVGNIRVIYSIEDEMKIINIENIGNRGDIYKRYQETLEGIKSLEKKEQSFLCPLYIQLLTMDKEAKPYKTRENSNSPKETEVKMISRIKKLQ